MKRPGARGTALASGEASRGLFRLETFAAFSSPNFRLLWLSSTAFFLAQGTQRFAFVWMMLELTDGTSRAGIVVFALGLPLILFSLPAGVLSDRHDRRMLIVGAALWGAMVMLTTAALLVAGQMNTPLALVIAIAAGTGMAVGQPVLRAVLPSIVTGERLMNAVVLSSMGANFARIFGTALGGFAIATWGIEGAFVVQAAMFVISAITALPLRISRQVAAAPRGMARDLGDGLRFIASHRPVLWLLVLMAISGLLMIGPILILLPEISRSRLGQDAFATSVFFSIFSGGTLTTSLVLASLGDLPRKGGWFLAAVISGGILTFGMGQSSVYALTAVICFLLGTVAGVFMNLNQTLIQSHTPDEMMGRVMGMHSLAMSAPTVGMLLAGFGAAALGDTWWMGASGLGLSLVAVILALAQPGLRRLN